MQKITANLWFDDQAEEAAKFYTSIFKNSKIGRIARYTDAGPRPKGSVMTVEFELDGQQFVALNGGAEPGFVFTHAISFIANCESQQEIDDLWEKLSAGGAIEECGWLKDRYGVSWQVVPVILPKLVTGDPVRADRVMSALMKMKKLDIAKLQQAYDGG